MNRVGGSCGRSHRGPARLAALLALGAATSARAEPVTELLRNADALWCAAAIAALALVVGAGLAWRALSAHRAVVDELHEARALLRDRPSAGTGDTPVDDRGTPAGATGDAAAGPASGRTDHAATPAAATRDTPAAIEPDNEYESFSFTVSHDLRAPIRVVEGFTKIVKEDYGRLLDRVGNDHLDRVLGAAARMNNMIDALLGLAKLSSQPLAHQPVNLSQLARFVTDDLTRQWPDRTVELTIAPELQVHGDPTLLRVVLENLLGNAWKYTGKAPIAVITFGRHAQDSDAFTVSDNGAGFDMRFADRLFGVFQRLHSASDFPGTGVGLASVRRIVRRHGGEIWGDGLVNGGARFHFSLPRAGLPRGAPPR